MKKTFINKVWHTNKLLFAFIIGFVFFQAFFLFKRVHNFPFYVFDMYSRQEHKTSQTSIFDIYINNDKLDLNKLTTKKKLILNKQIAYYDNFITNGSDRWVPLLDKISKRTPIDLSTRLKNSFDKSEQFPSWLINYLGYNFHETESLKVIKTNYHLYPKPTPTKSEIIIQVGN